MAQGRIAFAGENCKPKTSQNNIGKLLKRHNRSTSRRNNADRKNSMAHPIIFWIFLKKFWRDDGKSCII